MICYASSIGLSPDTFEIDELYRFEDLTDSWNEMIIIATSSEKYNIKGLVVNVLGMYPKTLKAKIAKKL